ncbi:hypothetical protein [Tessaracoccus sp. Z1128]
MKLDVTYKDHSAVVTLRHGKARSAFIRSRDRFLSEYKHIRPKLDTSRDNWNWPIALEYGKDTYAPTSWVIAPVTTCPLCLQQGESSYPVYVRPLDVPMNVLMRATLCSACFKGVFTDE